MSATPQSDDDVVMAELAESGSKWKTIFGRMLLGCLVVLLAIELHGRFGYDRTLSTLRANASKVMGDAIHGVPAELEEWSLPLPEAEKSIKGFPSQTRKVVFGESIVVLRWFSLFKTYVIKLHLDDNVVISLTTDDDE